MQHLKLVIVVNCTDMKTNRLITFEEVRKHINEMYQQHVLIQETELELFMISGAMLRDLGIVYDHDYKNWRIA